MFKEMHIYQPFVSPWDPCPSFQAKTYVTPPHLFLGFQSPNLPQYSAKEALKHGVLWPALYSSYEGRREYRRGGAQG